MAEGDQFATLSSAAMKEAATAAINMVEGVAGAALGAVGGVAFEFFETLGERNNEAIAAFRLNALEDEVINLRNELRALVRRLAAEGKRPDRQDPMTQTVAASEFVRNVAEARTVEKRTAIVNATVAQFDPRKGTPPMRDYWLGRVRELPEANLSFLLLTGEDGGLAVGNDVLWIVHAGTTERNQFVEPRPIARESMVAYQIIARRLEHDRIVTTGSTVRFRPTPTAPELSINPYQPSPEGLALLSFCKGD